jgi:hypothetical protein
MRSIYVGVSTSSCTLQCEWECLVVCAFILFIFFHFCWYGMFACLSPYMYASHAWRIWRCVYACTGVNSYKRVWLFAFSQAVCVWLLSQDVSVTCACTYSGRNSIWPLARANGWPRIIWVEHFEEWSAISAHWFCMSCMHDARDGIFHTKPCDCCNELVLGCNSWLLEAQVSVSVVARILYTRIGWPI